MVYFNSSWSLSMLRSLNASRMPSAGGLLVDDDLILDEMAGSLVVVSLDSFFPLFFFTSISLNRTSFDCNVGWKRAVQQ